MQTETRSPKEITRDSYQATAHEYARNVAELAPLESIDHFLSLLPGNPKIIDLGCGSGRDAKIFTSKGAEVVGIDFCPNLLEIAKSHAHTAEFQLMDIEAMNFPAASFDGAWAVISLVHIAKNNLPDVLKQIHALLKTNGYFYLALKQGSGEGLEVDMRYESQVQKFWAYYEASELKQMLTAAQFKILELDPVAKSHPYHSHAAFRVFCQKA